MNLFRVRGIQLAVHSSFFILIAYVAWLGWQPDPTLGEVASGWSGVFWNIVILLAFFACVVLHELGHSLTAMRFGVGVRRILLLPIGGMAEFDSIPREPGRELLITVAGPAVNFALAALLWLFVQAPAAWPFGEYEFTADALGFAQLLLHWNLIMGFFNLIPVFPMDGGRILRALLALRLPYLQATGIAAAVGKVLAITAIAVALLLPELKLGDSRAFLPAALFAFIYVAGDLEYRAARRREREEAHWKKLIEQFQAHRPIDEPPILSP